jgi:hypothetical protein
VIRAFGDDAEPTVAIDGNHPTKDQVNVVVDGLHWWIQLGAQHARLRVVLDRPSPEAADAVRTLVGVINHGPGAPTVELDVRREIAWRRTSLPNWAEKLEKQLAGGRPPLVKELTGHLGDEHPCFRWYQNLTEGYWSGRVEGLEVVRVRADGRGGRLHMGRRHDPSPNSAVAAFRQLVGGEGYRFGQVHDHLPRAELSEIADYLRALAGARESGPLHKFYPEHRLESRILRGDVSVHVHGQQLEPVGEVGQFPTAWSAAGRARYLDALMRTVGRSRTPWAGEIKIAPRSGLARYYRHGIPQALLYRQYIRTAQAVSQFFDSALDLDAGACQAALIVPAESGPVFESSRRQLERLADLFCVHLVTVRTSSP